MYESKVTATYRLAELHARILKVAIEEHRADFNSDHIRDFPDLFIQAEKDAGEDGDAVTFYDFNLMMSDMFVAGSETTSTVLQWTMLFLAMHLDIQARCHETIDNVIETGRLPTLADRSEMTYIDAVR